MFVLGRESFTVKEGEFVEIPILRVGDYSRSQSVRVATSDRHIWIDGENCSATAGSDYEPLNCTVSFAAGETVKYVKLHAKSDYLTEPDEYLTIQLLAVDYNSIGYPNTATVVIEDVS
ncbi:MAG: hypothetical protein MUE44_34665 [Oscillatoriaceae cyanobacterium Prado104]|jgi:hypothetical protein|nr:hypothetical protein [Oscillatoriaceae cyanobacterium Prado104]